MSQNAITRAASQRSGAQAQGAGMTQKLQQMNMASTQTTYVGEGGIPDKPSGYSDFDKVHERFDDVLVKTAKDINKMSPFTSADPQDAKFAMMTQLIDENEGVIPGIGKAFVPVEYFDYCARKVAQSQNDAFKRFIFQQIDLTTPAKREWWESRFPEYVNEYRRAWAMETQYNAQIQWVQINGVQDINDLWFLFCRANGLDKFASAYDGVPKAIDVPANFNRYVINKNGKPNAGNFPLNNNNQRTKIESNIERGQGQLFQNVTSVVIPQNGNYQTISSKTLNNKQ